MRPSEAELPYFSIVVPTHGRPEPLSNLLRRLESLSYPAARFEVIVVDDGGGIPLEPVLGRGRGLNLTLLRQPRTGPGGARNRGAAAAQGRYLAFTDDDCLPSPGWLSAFALQFQRQPDSLCGGRTLNAFPLNPYSAASQLLTDFLHQRYNPVHTFGAFFAANNFALPREAFLRLGGFEPGMRFGEDRDLCYRWALQGGGFQYAPSAVVEHAHPMTLPSFLRLHFLYGTGTGHFWKRGSAAGTRPATRNGPGWYLDLVLHGARTQPGPRGVWLSLLLAASQGATLLGILRESLRQCPPPGPAARIP